jgi:hypothetical protein
MMDITRNQYLMAGLVFIFLGIQFRLIDTVVLTPECTKMLAEQTGHPVAAIGETTTVLTGTQAQVPSKIFRPPEWLGWLFLSIGSVLVLHSLAMRRPD